MILLLRHVSHRVHSVPIAKSADPLALLYEKSKILKCEGRPPVISTVLVPSNEICRNRLVAFRKSAVESADSGGFVPTPRSLRSKNRKKLLCPRTFPAFAHTLRCSRAQRNPSRLTNAKLSLLTADSLSQRLFGRPTNESGHLRR